MTYTLTIEEIKFRFDELIPLLENNDVVLTSNGVPVARISPISHHQTIEELLSDLSRSEELHSEQEFEDYDKLYPLLP